MKLTAPRKGTSQAILTVGLDLAKKRFSVLVGRRLNEVLGSAPVAQTE